MGPMPTETDRERFCALYILSGRWEVIAVDRTPQKPKLGPVGS